MQNAIVCKNIKHEIYKNIISFSKMHNVVNTGANICNYLFLRYTILLLQKHCSAHRTMHIVQCIVYSV